jgi:hypothetical protein
MNETVTSMNEAVVAWMNETVTSMSEAVVAWMNEVNPGCA